MGSDYLINPLLFLIDAIVGFYIWALLLRFLFQWVNADFYNPIAKFIVKITHPPLRWLRRLIPSVGRIDTAALVLVFVLQLAVTSLTAIATGVTLSLPALAISALVQLLDQTLNLLLFAIIIRAVLSWIAPSSYHPANDLLVSLTEPLMRLGRRVIPSIGGVDLSPLVPLMGIQLTKMLLIPPLQYLAVLLSRL